MRFKSNSRNGYTIYAVTGVNSISFAIDASKANKKGLLGFSVKRTDPKENEEYFMFNYKVFKEVIPHPKPNTPNSSFEFPIQSFVWDDFTSKPDRQYTYTFIPVKGSPRLLRHQPAIEISVRTEPLYSKDNTHDVFFNRGVASSQAYALKFGNQIPDRIADPRLRKAALDWLSRNLDDAMIRFIRRARRGDTLLGCFYEFRYAPVLAELKKAIDEGVNVRIIYDAKQNSFRDKKGRFHESFPAAENLRAITEAGIPRENVIERTANRDSIQHNKFMVLIKGKRAIPKEVWFGSTNLSAGGIHGQTNVGHWIRKATIAKTFKDYWTILSNDPGMDGVKDKSLQLKANKQLKSSISSLSPDLPFSTLESIPSGETCFFSPRINRSMLEIYSQILDAARNVSCITLAFGINDVFKKYLKDNNQQDQITFILLDKKDKPNKSNQDTFVYINSANNVYKAFGSYIKDPLYQWTREVNTQSLKLNFHVNYIHSKFLLVDPLGADPIVITGSANFSESSTTSNDEGMVLIKGNMRVADIYFTEFMRLFNHYYFRSVFEELQNNERRGQDEDEARIFLCPNDTWLKKYKRGTFRWKRVKMFREMEGM